MALLSHMKLRVQYNCVSEVMTDSEVQSTSNPYTLFSEWYDIACKTADVQEANAMGRFTATPNGQPSSRAIRMNSFSAQGLKFYSNYESRKGKVLSENPNACVLFYWPPLHRQVRIEGTVSRLSEESIEDSIKNNPHYSQMGAYLLELNYFEFYHHVNLSEEPHKTHFKKLDDGTWNIEKL